MRRILTRWRVSRAKARRSEARWAKGKTRREEEGRRIMDEEEKVEETAAQRQKDEMRMETRREGAA